MKHFAKFTLGTDLSRTSPTKLAAPQLLLCALAGAALGCLIANAVEYGLNWRQHGSADPRCVLRWSGYVEVHSSTSGHIERITCEYRPDVGLWWPKKG